ncbi:serine-rich repeat protein 2 [Clonorchis sinensis]|uniref:Serine-rich repeat protein 2 n=1 Tax=Clonorchis sinensis TaxID=79923 RepID=G7Y8S8_CLOSI|nr:serine-rich repeat protein 2 [Clonorchis sinensis]
MPNTVNIERHKLNQAMYQKLKRYIMSKRKRELEEKAQDDHFKKLRREREERKLQAEFDAEDLEKTRGENKQFGIGAGIMGPCVNLPAQHLLHAHYSNAVTRESTSPHRGVQNAAVYSSATKPSQVPVSVSSALSSGVASLPCTTLANNHAAAVAAVAAALAAQQRTGTATDSIFANTAAAAAYLNAIVSLTSTPPTSVSSLANAPLGVLNPNSVGFNEALAALAASGFYSLPSLPPTSAANIAHGISLGRNASPTSGTNPDGSFPKNGRAGVASQATVAAVAALAQQTIGLSKGFPTGQRHPIAGALDTPVSTPPNTTTTVSAAATSTSLPPAPISYRGSITTGRRWHESGSECQSPDRCCCLHGLHRCNFFLRSDQCRCSPISVSFNNLLWFRWTSGFTLSGCTNCRVGSVQHRHEPVQLSEHRNHCRFASTAATVTENEHSRQFLSSSSGQSSVLIRDSIGEPSIHHKTFLLGFAPMVDRIFELSPVISVTVRTHDCPSAVVLIPFDFSCASFIIRKNNTCIL